MCYVILSIDDVWVCFFFLFFHFTTLIESLSKGNPYEQEVITNLKQHISQGLNTVLQI